MSHFTVAKSASQGCRRVKQPKALFLSFVFDSEMVFFITAQPAFKDRGSVSIQCFFVFSEWFIRFYLVWHCDDMLSLLFPLSRSNQVSLSLLFSFLLVCLLVFCRCFFTECFRFSVYALTMFKKFEVSMCLKNDKLKRDRGTNHNPAPIAALNLCNNSF